jgi:predicted nucleotidyltransferase
MIDSLETMFKHKVDLLTTSALESPSMNPHLKDSISSTARLVHDVSGLAKNPSP